MKKLSLCILALGIASSAFGSGCTGSLQSLITAGSCSVGNFTFNNFLYLEVNVLSPAITAADIQVNATVTNGQPDMTFTPTPAFSAGGLLPSVADYILGFEVTSTVPTIGFQSVNLGDLGSVVNGPLGLSTGAVAEVDCYGGLLQLPNPLTGIVGIGCLNSGVAVGATATLPTGTGVSASVPIEFSGFSTTVDVIKDVTLVAALGGSASVSGVSQSFTTETGGASTPEPASFFLGGCGLIALAFVGRRRMKKASTAI